MIMASTDKSNNISPYFILLMFLIDRPIITFCNEFMKISEGENTTMTFKYDREPGMNFKIRMGKDIFYFYYNGEIINAGLTESQQGRFAVDEYESGNSSVTVLVRIENVKREDEAKYTCEALKNRKKIINLSRTITLIVDFAMGPINCFPISNKFNIISDLWVLIECNASVGRYEDFIACYQDGEMVPSLIEYIMETVVQRVWMKRMQTVVCCSTTSTDPLNSHDCHDFIWDPVAESKVFEGDESNTPGPSSSNSTELKEMTTFSESQSTLVDHLSVTHQKTEPGHPKYVEYGYISDEICFVTALAIVIFIYSSFIGHVVFRSLTERRKMG